LDKSIATFHKSLIKVSLILLGLSILISAIAVTQTVEAQTPILFLNPRSGPVGTDVLLTSTEGFGSGTWVSVTFGQQQVITTRTTGGGKISASFTVPNVNEGVYPVTVTERITDSQGRVVTGISAYVKFTVGESSGTSDDTTTPSDSDSSTPDWTFPDDQTSGASGGGFDPLWIGLIAVVAIVILVPVTAFYLRSGRGDRGYEEERPRGPHEKPEMPSAPNVYQEPSRGYQPSYRSQQPTGPTGTPQYRQAPSYGISSQPSRPLSTTRYSRPSSYGRQTMNTKICRYCKQPVRGDYNICPFCNRRLR
jgi:hypothetical protein